MIPLRQLEAVPRAPLILHFAICLVDGFPDVKGIIKRSDLVRLFGQWIFRALLLMIIPLPNKTHYWMNGCYFRSFSLRGCAIYGSL